jgi:hypothetical protein
MKATNVHAKRFHQTTKSAAFLPRFAAQVVESGSAMPTQRTSNGIPVSACPVLTETEGSFHSPLLCVQRDGVRRHAGVGDKDQSTGKPHTCRATGKFDIPAATE